MGNTEELRVDTGLKKICVNDYGDCITVSLEDSGMAGRYAELIKNLEQIAADAECEDAALNKKYAAKPIISDEGEIEIDTEQVIERNNLQIKYINKMIPEIEAVFGMDCIRKVYRECYEENEDFVPSIAALIEFIEQINPVMERLFKERFEFNKRKFNRGRRGKHSRTRQELLEELREKSGAYE